MEHLQRVPNGFVSGLMKPQLISVYTSHYFKLYNILFLDLGTPFMKTDLTW